MNLAIRSGKQFAFAPRHIFDSQWHPIAHSYWCVLWLHGLSASRYRYLTVSIPDKPDKPIDVRPTEIDKDNITIAWDEPKYDGGSPITGYSVERRDAKKSTWVSVGTTDELHRTLKVTKLTEGNSYFFRVYAENAIGQSEPAENAEPVTAKLPFGKITGTCRGKVFFFYKVLVLPS